MIKLNFINYISSAAIPIIMAIIIIYGVLEKNKVYDSRENCNAIIDTSTNTLIKGCHNTVIPTTVTSIGAAAFEGCPLLENITLPGSITSIDYGAFSYCANLTTITIPK